jgi:para-nitrobenzyl esterase
MKRILSTLVLYLLIYKIALAGTETSRYKDIIFRETKIDSVIYSTQKGKPLYMDVYQPVGDTASQRPLVILAHGGSFIHGDRHAERMPILCRELAMRGFVAVSIDYRLTTLFGMFTKRSAYKAMMKAVADGRNSVRWFINDAANENTYRIDRSKIFFGGSSAGAILTEQLAYIDSAGECKGILHKIVNKYLPDSGALPPDAIRGFISLAGGVLDTMLIGPSHTALLHIHGDADNIVPYYYKRPVNGLAPFKLAGLGGSRPRYISQRLDFTEYVFAGEGHTPWDHDNNALKIVIEQIVAFLNKVMK